MLELSSLVPGGKAVTRVAKLAPRPRRRRMDQPDVEPDVVSFAALWRRAARRLKAKDSKLLDLDDDALRVVHGGLSDPLNPRVAAAFRRLCRGLREPTRALLKQLRDEHDAAAALCLKLGMPSCRALREELGLCITVSLSAADLALLGTLGRSLPVLVSLALGSDAAGVAGPDGVLRLAERLGAGALPALTTFVFASVHVGDAGASALAAALGRGAGVAHKYFAELKGGQVRQRARAQPRHQPQHAIGAGCACCIPASARVTAQGKRHEHWQGPTQRTRLQP